MSERTELLARYKHLREVGMRLSTRLIKALPKDVFDEGGKRLGILKGRTLVLDSEDEMAVVMDFCLHDVRRQGLNAFDRYLAESPPPPDSDEMVLLQAHRQARFSLYELESMEPGVGVHVRDIIRNEPLFLVDVNFSRTGLPGVILAARVIVPDGISMTTGAGLPVGQARSGQHSGQIETVKASLQASGLGTLPPEQASEFTATILRSCLERGGAEHIRYADVGSEPVRGRPPAAAPGRGHVGAQ